MIRFMNYFSLLLFLIFSCFNISAQNPVLIKDNLVGEKDGCPFSRPVDDILIAYKSKIYLSGTNRFADFSTEGDFEPWVYDPSTNELSLFAQLVPFKGSTPNKFFISGDKLFFGARDEFYLTDQLYVTDGNRNNLINLCDSAINQFRGMLVSPSRNTVVPFKNGAIFNAYENLSSFSLWFTDGTKQGTIRLNKNGFSDNFVVHPKYNVVVFTQDNKFMVSDGTVAGTKVLNDLINIVEINSNSNAIGVFGDHYIFEALDVSTGSFGVFVTKGISSQYTKLIEFDLNLPNSRNITTLPNGNCIFSTNKGIFITDGTASGTKKVPGLASFNLNNPYSDLWTIYKSNAYFAATDVSSGKGVELFTSDGTVEGTKMLSDINPNGSSNPSNFKVHQELLFFSANNGTQGNELWYTDGASSARLTDINSGSKDSNPMFLTGLDNNLYFTATTDAEGRELYKYSLSKVNVENIRLQDNQNIYYNSSSGELILPDNERMKGCSVFIYDLLGRNIYSVNRYTGNVNLKSLNFSSGNYIVSITKNEKILFNIRFSIP